MEMLWRYIDKNNCRQIWNLAQRTFLLILALAGFGCANPAPTPAPQGKSVSIFGADNQPPNGIKSQVAYDVNLEHASLPPFLHQNSQARLVIDKTKHVLRLTGFQPVEKIQILGYVFDRRWNQARFMGWTGVEADPTGYLEISYAEEGITSYSALGAKTGIVYPQNTLGKYFGFTESIVAITGTPTRIAQQPTESPTPFASSTVQPAPYIATTQQATAIPPTTSTPQPTPIPPTASVPKENNSGGQSGSKVSFPTVGTFSESALALDLPPDILQELTHVTFYQPMPSSSTQTPTFCSLPTRAELGQPMDFWLCGLAQQSASTLTIYFPDGRQKSRQIDNSKAQQSLHLRFITSLDYPEGAYRFVWQGSNKTITGNVSFINPSVPTAVSTADSIFLFGFAPNERVRIFAYLNKQFIGSQTFRVNSEGKGQVKLGQRAGDWYFQVIGDYSGKLQVSRADGNGETADDYTGFPTDTQQTINNDGNCSNSPRIRLALGVQARVPFGNGLPLRIRSQPSTRVGVLARLPEGAAGIQITGGPVCNSGLRWWQIQIPNLVGWVAEGQGNEYFLEPLSVDNSPTTSGNTNPSGDCSLAPPQRAQVGMTVRVSGSETGTVRLRATPSQSGDVLDQLPIGTAGIEISGGPVCRDTWRWWRVTFRGQTGWISEGNRNLYYLTPITLDDPSQDSSGNSNAEDCSSAPPQRLRNGSLARVVTSDGVRLRQQPSRVAAIIKAFPPNTTLQITSEPVCREGWRWWQVSLQGKHGWMSEGDRQEYYIAPAQF